MGLVRGACLAKRADQVAKARELAKLAYEKAAG